GAIPKPLALRGRSWARQHGCTAREPRCRQLADAQLPAELLRAFLWHPCEQGAGMDCGAGLDLDRGGRDELHARKLFLPGDARQPIPCGRVAGEWPYDEDITSLPEVENENLYPLPPRIICVAASLAGASDDQLCLW